MADAFDQVKILVPDLDQARADYEALLGFAPTDQVQGVGEQGEQSSFALRNTVLTLCQSEVEAARVDGVVLRDAKAGPIEALVPNALGLSVAISNGAASEQMTRDAQLSVDHLVLRTGDADACVEFFAQEMGIRLALDKTVPEWGGRMLFFRAGKMTLEVIQSDDAPPEQNAFWGIALQLPDIDGFCASLSERGVAVSEVREGRKPGTRVATVKSHDLGIPTLLIQPAD